MASLNARSGEILYAFYDFEVSPASFDISKYLVLAELNRRERGFESIHLVIVPDAHGWARADDLHDSDQQSWRLRNILYPIVSLMPSVRGLMVCPSRDAARDFEATLMGEVFPANHTTDHPVAQFEWAEIAIAVDREIPSLKAAPQARKYARNWMRERAGDRKVVSMTLREMDQQSHRNNDHDAWYAFAESLDKEHYCPVIIRDTHFALDLPKENNRGVYLFPEAAMNIELRTGFYEECYLNLFVNNGPAEIALLDVDIAYLFFMKIRTPLSRGIAQEIPDYGIPHRGEHPVHGPHQHTVWDGDSLEVLKREFTRMVAVLDGKDKEIAEFRARDNFPAQPIDSPVLCDLLTRGGCWRQADSLVADLTAQGIYSAAEANYLMGVSRLSAGLEEEAVSYFQTAVSFEDSNGEYHEALGLAYIAGGEIGPAVEQLRIAAKMSAQPKEIDLKLAMALNSLGNFDEAEAILRGYLDAGDDSPSVMRILADALKQKGNLKEAIEYELQAISRG